MNPDTYWMVTLLDKLPPEFDGQYRLIRVLCIIDANDPGFDSAAYMDPENLAALKKRLQLHFQGFGPIVEMESLGLFDVARIKPAARGKEVL